MEPFSSLTRKSINKLNIYIFTHTHIYIYIALKAPNAILFYGRHSSPVSKQLLLGDKLQ